MEIENLEDFLKQKQEKIKKVMVVFKFFECPNYIMCVTKKKTFNLKIYYYEFNNNFH